MLQTAPAPGVLEVSATARRRVSRPDPLAPRDGQLRHTQASQSASLAQRTSSFRAELWADELELVESGRTVVRRTHFQTSPSRIVQQRGRPQKGDRRVSGRLERKSKALCMDGLRRIHSAEAGSLPVNP